MAIVLSFSLTESADRTKVVFMETTGAYDANHLSSWGAPNVTLASATWAKIQIAKREENGTYTNANLISAFPSLPSGTNGTFDLTAAAAGYGDTFEDGIYSFDYSVKNVDNGGATIWSYHKLNYKILYGNISCCYRKKTLEAIKCGTCACNNADFMCFFVQYTLLQQAIYAYETLKQDNLDEIQALIDVLTNLCNDGGCSSC